MGGSAVTVGLLDQLADGLQLQAIGWTDETGHLPLGYRFGYYRLPLHLSTRAASGDLPDSELGSYIVGSSSSEYVPLHRGFTQSPVLNGVQVSPSEEAKDALTSAPDVAQAVVLSVRVRDQLGATVESLYAVDGAPVLVRVLGDDSVASSGSSNATAVAEGRLDSLADSAQALSNEIEYLAVGEVLSVLQTLSGQVGALAQTGSLESPRTCNASSCQPAPGSDDVA